MALCRVDKVVVVCLLEAAKATMEQIGARRLELQDGESNETRELVSLYGELRRLKDYLQRCIGAFRDQVDLDLAEQDLPLLTACCTNGFEATDRRLGVCTNPRDRKLLTQKRELLGTWAVEFASEPLVKLPLPRSMGMQSEAVRTLQHRLSEKLRDQAQRAAEPGGGVLAPMVGVDGRRMDRLAEPAAQPLLDSGRLAVTPLAVPDPAQPSPAPPPGEVGVDQPSEHLRLEVSRLRDPRLRAILAMDLRALDRAVNANDLRLAVVHLTSILEAAVIDHAMPRMLEFGLHGSPDTWNAQELLLRVFGDKCSPRDRASAYYAFAARSLIRPAVQVKSPMVVTAVSFRKHLEFVGRALREMGYTP